MLIGFTGALESGKDTACKLIQDYYYPDRLFERRAFADKLKVSAARALGFDGDVIECIEFCNILKEHGVIHIEADGLIEERNITGREYLQWYGTEAHRKVFNMDFWIDAVLPSDKPNYGHTHDVIVTDARFDNEAFRIKHSGGVIWEIVRGKKEEGGHVSERGISRELIDKTFENNGTLKELQEKLVAAVEEHFPIVKIPEPKRERYISARETTEAFQDKYGGTIAQVTAHLWGD